MEEVVVVEALRTPIGRFQGALAAVRPDDLAASVMSAVMARVGIDAGHLDEVVLGCANQAGEDNRNVARMALLLAGFPQTVPGVTVNRLCASGLEAVNQAARAIRTGDAKLVLAGGVESMSRAPYSMPRGPQHPKAGNFTVFDTSLGWRYPNPAMEAMFPLEAMGDTAENIAVELQITRAEQDAFAARSHARAVAAAAAGHFDREIVRVDVPGPKGKAVRVAADEGPRPDTTIEALGRLQPAFRRGGTVTAGNASGLNDGAAAVLLASRSFAEAHGLPFRARVRSMAAAGVDPRTMGYGPVPASRKALERLGRVPTDVETWELNEAFAAQSIGCVRRLGLDDSRVNRHGGAIALGHPLGCSGARLVATLLGAMEASGTTLGVVTLCVGVGQGVATVFER